jgi:adenylosuccinate lyase
MTGREISPIDGRYSAETTVLSDYFSEWALIKNRVRIEIEWLITTSKSDWFEEIRTLSQSEILFLRDLVKNFDDSSVLKIKEIEKTTNHDVKAVENYLRGALKNTPMTDVVEFIHFGCTSDDINNLSYALMLKDGISNVWTSKAEEMMSLVSQAANEYRNIPMISRTHGQAATPTTIGKELAVFVYRWQRQLTYLKSIKYLGKFNGVVGNFNAQVVAYPDAPWEDISRNFVEGLGLGYNPLTTQIEPHDYMAECFHGINRFNNITLNFDRDMWMYISLGYFKQHVIGEETGSSTMPHKVNPINFENSEANVGLSNSILSHLVDKLQVSRLQRDLSDSSALRNIGTAIAHSYISIHNAITGFKRLAVNKEAIDADISSSWEVLAEAIQTVMRKYGCDEPYEALKEFTRGKKIDKEDIREFITNLEIPKEDKNRLLALTPDGYIGIAPGLVDWIK